MLFNFLVIFLLSRQFVTKKESQGRSGPPFHRRNGKISVPAKFGHLSLPAISICIPFAFVSHPCALHVVSWTAYLTSSTAAPRWTLFGYKLNVGVKGMLIFPLQVSLHPSSSWESYIIHEYQKSSTGSYWWENFIFIDKVCSTTPTSPS